VVFVAGLVTAALAAGVSVWWSLSQSIVATDRPALSIVVVPFRNLSNDPEQEYFARGVSNDLTTELSRLPGLFVIANATAQTLRRKTFDAREIGRDLQVRYLLDGSVRRTSSHVRITTELIDSETSATLWADRFDLEPDQLGLWQDDIIGRIANTLNYQLTRLEGKRSRREQQANPVASDLTTRAWALIYTAKKPETYVSARELFRRALLLDPEAVNALAGIGWTSAVMVLDGWSITPAQDIAAADSAVTKALTIDPNLVVAHQVRGFLLRMQRRTDAARDAFQTAISINPNFAPGYAQLGATEVELGRPDAAILAVKRAMRLSPRDPSLGPWLAFLGISELHLGHYRAAASWLVRAIETGTPVARHHAYLASALALAGKVSEARIALARFRTAQPSATIASLRSGGKSTEAAFLRQQEEFFKGLRIAGLPE
jgi:TolB-like protein/Tfp pilus assembly protein PilF